MYYLDTANGASMFREARQHTDFVDKSALIDDLYRYARKENKYIAITKPRRFGKTMAANMLSAFFTKGQDAEELFSGLVVEERKEIWGLRNSFHVIHMDFLPELGEAYSFTQFLDRIRTRLRMDLVEAFPAMEVTDVDDLPSLLSKTGESFVFILDEWDAVFESGFMTEEDRLSYVLFLRGLFKNRAYVHLALLTGILPIAKYTSGSPMNMFHEFNSFGRIGFEEYYGFSEEEIQGLIENRRARVQERQVKVQERQVKAQERKVKAQESQTQAPDRRVQAQERQAGANGMRTTVPDIEEIRLWYDGYVRRSDGGHIYNPDSVCKALIDGRCQNNWVGTGPMDDIANLIAGNAFEIRGDILRMLAGESIEIQLDGFGAEERVPTTKKDILSAMVVYGFLAYHDGKLSIPNLELTQKFSRVLDRGTLGVHMTLEESRKLLEATLSGREKEVAAAIERTHDEQIPFIVYSDENSLACVIMYAYYAASDWYEVRREEKSGKGFVDFLFSPLDHRHIPIIMELKYNRSARAAIAQIRDKNYIQRMKDSPEVLFVGINYSTRTKKHTCLIRRTNYAAEMALKDSE